jgi:SUMO ligase MMS21 Smc5/6 complex component
MTIHKLLDNTAFGPEEIQELVTAYEHILSRLSLVERKDDPVTEIIKKVIKLGQRGIRDAEQLTQLALKELGVE